MMMFNAALALFLAAPPQSLETLAFNPEATHIDTARVLAETHPAALGLGDGDALRDLVVLPLRRGTLIKARRTHDGLPVIGQSLALRLDESGRPISVQSDFAPLPPMGKATVSAAEAAAAVAERLFAVSIDPAAVDTSTLPMRLAVDPRRAALVWVVHVAHVLPQWRRTALVHARTGQVLEVQSPVKRAADDAHVYQSVPAPDAILAAPDTVTLERLTPATPQYLEGEYVTALSCLIDDDNVRVRTCLDVFGGLACAAPEFADLIVSFCGEGHLAEGQGEPDGFMFDPEDDLTDYGAGVWPLADPFAEVNIYYHLDQVTHWLRALGHPVAAHTPFQIMANVSMPEPALFECEATAWAAEPSGTRTSQRAREIVAACRAAGFDYAAFDNAFYLGNELEALVGVGEGIYMGQGSVVDFAYDGGIVYHEYGHALAAQVSSLGAGELTDVWGMDNAPGALGEGYGDYVAGAFTDDAVLGGYVGGRYGQPEGIRNLSHDLVCPTYLTGEVHDDSQAWAAALWDARELYPQTEVDDDTGSTIRTFDRLVYEALASLTDLSNQADAAAATIGAVMAEPSLDDPEGAKITCAFEARNVIDCQRAQPLCETPIHAMYFGAAGGGGLMGGPTYSPFKPGPFQLVVIPNGATSAELVATLGDGPPSFENPPDFIGGGTPDPAWDLRLHYSADIPVLFDYSGSVNVTANSDGVVNLTVYDTTPTKTAAATLTLPAGASRVYFALANHTEASGVLGNIAIDGFSCPAAPPAPSTIDCTTAGEVVPNPTPGGDEDGGCNCAGASGGLAGLSVLLLAWRRRR